MNSFYNHGSVPAANSPGLSSVMRAEFEAIAAGFNLLPTLAGNAGKILTVNAGGTAIGLLVGALSLAGDLTIAGAYPVTLTATAATTLTLPTTGTLAVVSGNLGTPTALIGTNITGNAAGLSIGGSAGTVTAAEQPANPTTEMINYD